MQRIELLDTTLRDGAQGEGVEHSLSDKRKIALALDRLGVPLIEGGNPTGNPKDQTFFEEARKAPFLTQAVLVPFVVIAVVSTVLVMSVTGLVAQWIIRRKGGDRS